MMSAEQRGPLVAAPRELEDLPFPQAHHADAGSRRLGRFTLATVLYIALCAVVGLAIILRGDGPHPRVTAIYPPDGDRYFPGGLVEITFSQPMDQASVERALEVSPGSQGEGAWYGNTLNLQPVGDWKPNVTYHVSLVGTVSDAQGRPLHTPITFWFRVHHVGRLTRCVVRSIQNVCEAGAPHRTLIPSPAPILSYVLSPDGSLIAYTRRDRSGLPHLFVVDADGTGNLQLTHGSRYVDSSPSWAPGDSTDITYERQSVRSRSHRLLLGKPRRWSISVDGSGNTPW